MSYNAIIIDDEKDAIELIDTYLQAYFKKIKVVETSQRLEKGLNVLSTQTPDVLFLDVEMNGATSFELLEKVQISSDTHIVFTTAHREYAYQAFNVNAAGYLLKPIYPKAFKSVVGSVLDKIENSRMLHLAQEEVDLKYAIPLSKSFKLSSLNQIIYCEAEGRYTHFYLSNGKKYTTAKTLKKIEEELPSGDFIRIHQSYLVNKNYIEEYRPTENSIILPDTITLSVSRNRKNELKLLFKNGLIAGGKRNGF